MIFHRKNRRQKRFNTRNKRNQSLGRLSTQKTCVQCQATFDCSGCASSGQSCWCARYPTALSCSTDDTAGCLCPHCLADIANEHINTLVDNVEVHTHQPHVAKVHTEKYGLTPLIEGIDYTVNAQGNWVLSRWFLLKKGKCCGSGCQNCPFGHVNVKGKVKHTLRGKPHK